jgi:Bacterial regulatory protein, Fis family
MDATAELPRTPRPRSHSPTRREPLGRRAYRLQEVCELLGISRPTLWRRHKAGLIKFTYLGTMPFVSAQHLAELLGERPTA